MCGGYMELLQLTYFCYAAGCESFSKTADHFRVPTSNISRAIRQIERELGVSLFQRTANRISLNERGKTFYLHAAEALKQLDSGRRAVSDKEGVPCGEIRLLLSTCRRIATEAIEKCRREQPEVSFTVRHGVGDGDFDFIVSDIPPMRSHYDKIRLTTERMLLAVRRDSPLSTNACTAEALSREPFISLGKGTRLHTLTERFCAELGFSPNIAIQTDDPYYVRKYLEMGLGVAVWPEKSWAQMLPDNATLIDVGFPERENFVFMKRGKKLSLAEKNFLDILIGTFEEA